MKTKNTKYGTSSNHQFKLKASIKRTHSSETKVMPSDIWDMVWKESLSAQPHRRDMHLYGLYGEHKEWTDICKRADEGDMNAQYQLGKLLLVQSSNKKKLRAEAVDWLKQAAYQLFGHEGAREELDRLYTQGDKNVQRDPAIEYMHGVICCGLLKKREMFSAISEVEKM